MSQAFSQEVALLKEIYYCRIQMNRSKLLKPSCYSFAFQEKGMSLVQNRHQFILVNLQIIRPQNAFSLTSVLLLTWNYVSYVLDQEKWQEGCYKGNPMERFLFDGQRIILTLSLWCKFP